MVLQRMDVDVDGFDVVDAVDFEVDVDFDFDGVDDFGTVLPGHVGRLGGGHADDNHYDVHDNHDDHYDDHDHPNYAFRLSLYLCFDLCC